MELDHCKQTSHLHKYQAGYSEVVQDVRSLFFRTVPYLAGCL